MSDAEQMMPSRWQDESEELLRVVERIALILNETGIPRMSARVLAYMLADDADRYSAAALADGLRVSPAANLGGCAASHRDTDGGQGARTREEGRVLPGL